ncbi:MAG: 23S rRNA (uridine(2552)-2'-O)-methyltransferase RlmE [SAR86 cluster bacterium]|uniref:Ribosomal RNA large subunit methyltransferase E n=1 Tax=SAR86 cluster bacterium TaxID=2030880 RepID=A0A2A4MGB7_9GAMM|nr:MAG: 23S rRNA (uridine(2552)-2'-O)-methyltransferase RlmE [SAR86 cluster bacterium]
MSRSKTSKNWLREHFDDEYVKLSRESGYRSRASFKLLEIQEKDKIFRHGLKVIDLGAAPGSWSQVAAELVGNEGVVIASDILAMDPIVGVEFVQGDFTEAEAYQQILEILNDSKVDLVISDMAPNMSGMKEIDQPKAMYLVELALELARSVLAKGGVFLVKVFHGAGLEAFKADLKRSFTTVKVRKPKASRARSSEIYLLASGFKGSV